MANLDWALVDDDLEHDSVALASQLRLSITRLERDIAQARSRRTAWLAVRLDDLSPDDLSRLWPASEGYLAGRRNRPSSLSEAAPISISLSPRPSVDEAVLAVA